MPLSPGTKLGPYKILAAIGAGGMAPILTPVIIDVRGGRADQIASGSDGLVDMFRATECRRLVYIYTLRQP